MKTTINELPAASAGKKLTIFQRAEANLRRKLGISGASAQQGALAGGKAAAAGTNAGGKLTIFQKAEANLRRTLGLTTAQATLPSPQGAGDATFTLGQLRAQLQAARGTIEQQAQELQELRAGRDQLEQTLRGLKKSQADVADTVAMLGFPSNLLPSIQPDEKKIGATAMDTLHEQYADEKDPRKKSAIFAQICALREAKNAGE